VPFAAPASGGGSFLPLLLIIVFIFGMYFLMIRPQQRRNREMLQMQSSLGPGAVVMTSSGIYGTVAEVDEEEGTIGLEVADGVTLRLARAAVARVVAPAEADEDEYEVEEADEVEDLADEVDQPTDTTPTPTPNPIIERKD
jgi:preprotein translocase subunit YajC